VDSSSSRFDGMMFTAAPQQSSVERQIQKANNDSRNYESGCRNVGIDQLIEIVEQEPALLRFDSGSPFECIFEQRQWTRPGKNFRENPPDQRNDVQTPEKRTRARHPRAENNPKNKESVHHKHQSSEHGIEAVGEDWMHVWVRA